MSIGGGTTDASAQALPMWRAPRVEIVADEVQARGLAQRLEQISDASLGIAAVVDPRPGLDVSDPRVGDPWAVVIARAPGPEDLEQSTAHVLCRDGLKALGRVLAVLVRPSGPYLVFHGAQVSITRLQRWSATSWAPAHLGCTQTAAVLLSQGRQRPPQPTLVECVERVLGHRLSVPRRIPGAEHEGLVQCASVADTLLPLAKRLMPMLRRRGLMESYRLECQLVPAVVAMEGRGMPVDAAAFERVVQGWRSEREVTEQPQRLARLDKLISTYGHWPRDFVVADRIHSRLHPLATDSGRFSCTDPNLQQVPSEHTAPGLRACFRASEGRKLIVADYAQIELRVAAHLAPCRALAGVFIDGRDPHRATAATLTGKPEADVTDHERKLAKAVNFGFLFGMGVSRFRQYAHDGYGVELDEAGARAARDAFFATFPGIAAWHRRVGAACKRSGALVVTTALGRRKRFDREHVSVPAALNIPVQGTAAEGFKRAMLALEAGLPAYNAGGVMCIHDEYLAEAPQDSADLVREWVVAIMTQAMSEVVPSVPIVVQAHVGSSWADAK